MNNTLPIPLQKDGARLCIAINSQGVTVYGNKRGFESMAEFFAWLASSSPSQNYELHTIMQLQDEASRFGGKDIKNVYALFDKETQKIFEQKSESNFGFDLTYMMVEEKDLDKLDVLQKNGLLPDDWNSEG